MLKIAKEEGKYFVSLFQVKKLNTLFSELISQQLNDLVREPGRQVIFNLEGVRFIDSAGFNTLLKAQEISNSAGSSFKLCNVSDEVMELMQVTELNNSLMILPDVEVREKIIMELDD